MTTLTLPSNASMQLFPNNTAAEFTTQLASEVSCGSGQYEAGLTEIIFPNDFHKKLHVDGNGIDWSISCFNNSGKLFAFTPTAGVYDNVFDAIASIMTQESHVGKFGVEQHKLGFIRLYFRDNVYSGSANTAQISRAPKPNEVILGLEMGKLIEVVEVMEIPSEPLQFLLVDKSKSMYDPTIEHIYVYSDLIQPRETGGTLEPLLRSVAVTGEKDRFQTVDYSKPYYFPLAKNNFRNIRVWITDKDGKRVEFRKSPVIIIINIRKTAFSI